MTADPTDPLEASLRANRVLAERVAELERELKRFGHQSSPALGSSLTEREVLLGEAERTAHMGSWVWDVESNEVKWSDELYRILGYDPARDLATTEAFFERVHPDDRKRVREASSRGIARGVGEQVAYRVLRQDGEVRQVTMDAALLFGADGNLKRLVGTVLDVTEASVAARELEKTAELLADAQHIGKMGSFEFSVESGELTWSDEFFRLVDVDPSTGASTELFLARVHPDDRERVGFLIMRAQTEGVVESSRARIVHRDGSLRHLDMSARVLRDGAGCIRAIRGTIADVTETVELEARFHQSQKMEAVGQLAGGLAHDYNNLMTVVLGNAELLREENDCQEVREIIGAATTATSVTNRLLTFTRQTHRTTRVARLNDEVRDAREILERAVGESVRIVHQDRSDESSVVIDGGQVQQLLLNLVINARDAMPRGGTVTISVTRRVLEPAQARRHRVEPGRFVLLSVADDGVGMDRETQRRVFEPFFTTKEEGHGTGLGLAMVFGTMRHSGGFVEVHSERGKGTQFDLWFPRVTAPVSDREPTGELLVDRCLDVLVVEDNVSVAKLAASILSAAGHTVRTATSGQEAISSWRAKPADVLVTDVVMAGMSGVDLADALRRARSALPVVFVTGYLPDRVGVSVMTPHTAVVRKPFQRGELLRALAQVSASLPE